MTTEKKTVYIRFDKTNRLFFLFQTPNQQQYKHCSKHLNTLNSIKDVDTILCESLNGVNLKTKKKHTNYINLNLRNIDTTK